MIDWGLSQVWGSLFCGAGKVEFMRKCSILMVFAVLAVSLLVSCEEYKITKVGKTGPGGGIIFYDVDADNDTGNQDNLRSDECGYRYLEAAPRDLEGQYNYSDAIAKCQEYSTVVKGKVYEDWYLPDRFFLNEMYNNLAKCGIGGFKDMEYYWSSNDSKYSNKAQAIKFKADYEAATLSKLPKATLCYVRPMRKIENL